MIIGQSYLPNTLLERLLFPEWRMSVVAAQAQRMGRYAFSLDRGFDYLHRRCNLFLADR
jgi:hypothetical protein